MKKIKSFATYYALGLIAYGIYCSVRLCNLDYSEVAHHVLIPSWVLTAMRMISTIIIICIRDVFFVCKDIP